MARSKVEIPQARSLDKVRETVEAVEAGVAGVAQLGSATNLSERHVNYHLNTGRILGWLEKRDYTWKPTAAGLAMLRTVPGSRDEVASFAAAIEASDSLRAVAPDLLAPAAPSASTLTRRIREATKLADSTARHRSLALLRWRERILGEQQSLFDELVPPKDLISKLTATSQELCLLRSVSFENWKSFNSATLFVDVLTILIGANAGGKSNALDALEFLGRTSRGEDLGIALAGGPDSRGIRGGVEWSARHPASAFTLCATVRAVDPRTEFEYRVTVETQPQVQLLEERLDRVKVRQNPRAELGRISLFRTDQAAQESPSIAARLYNRKAGIRREFRRSTTLLSQLDAAALRSEIREGVDATRRALGSIFVLDPIPSRMRDYAPLSDALSHDASNVAGVLAALPQPRRHDVEQVIAYYLRRLPERDIQRVWAEPIGKFQRDAMIYCREHWVESEEPSEIDARGMSDGTLRFIAILTALLTRPSGSVLVVEEIDNGLHPSRASLLLSMLKTIGTRRRIDVLVTTHNRALLDDIGPELVPFVVVAHRNTPDGTTSLTLLEDVSDLPKILAAGSVGQAVATGLLGESLHRDRRDG